MFFFTPDYTNVGVFWASERRVMAELRFDPSEKMGGGQSDFFTQVKGG